MSNISLLNLYKIYNKKILCITYVFLFSIAFLQRLGSFPVNYYVKYIISGFWILLAIMQLIIDNRIIKKYEFEIRFYFKLFIVPIIFITIYNLVLFTFGIADREFAGRCISNIVTMFITIISAFATIYLLKDKTIKYTIISIASSFFIVIIYNLFISGPVVFINAFNALTNSTDIINVFEVHDLTFAVGLILLAYMYFSRRFTVKELKVCLLTIFIMLMGFKRIQLLAIILVVIYMLLLRHLKEKLRNRVLMLTGYVMLVVCYIYVFIIKMGYLNDLVNLLGINTMGRISFYNWISKYFQFNPKYLGLGLGATSKMMQIDTHWPIATIHSDILRMFIELGFIGFGIWAGYYLIYCYKAILKTYTLIEAEFYFILTLYLFLLHFTDNTVNYFTTQYIYIIFVTIFTVNKDNGLHSESKNLGNDLNKN